MSEKVVYEKQMCKYEFSENELKEVAERLALQTQKKTEIEDEKKAVLSTYKQRLDQIQMEINKAASQYKNRYEMREIECAVERDFTTGEIRYIRTDTGQIASTERMSMSDRQMRIEEFIN
jgi:phage host-nuclease inhibitor protein Gam